MVALFLSVTRAIERESSRCCDAHRSQVLYVMSWFLKAHLYLHTKGSKRSEEVDYGIVASVFDPRCLVLVLRIMRDAADHKNWTELHAAMGCFEELVSAEIILLNKS
jgi:replication fork protection complex subunit Tof1/Swi1